MTHYRLLDILTHSRCQLFTFYSSAHILLINVWSCVWLYSYTVHLLAIEVAEMAEAKSTTQSVHANCCLLIVLNTFMT